MQRVVEYQNVRLHVGRLGLDRTTAAAAVVVYHDRRRESDGVDGRRCGRGSFAPARDDRERRRRRRRRGGGRHC
jgi:hypothetical protein